jgi:TPP-dependent pyruvate/acetoin dehydrogenase alpha subunit
MKALIFENKVVDLVETEFPVSPEMTWMNAPDGCKNGWILDGTDLVAPTYTGPDAAAQLRKNRDNLLGATDWWAMSDRTMSDAQTTYRQELRDLPATASPVLDSNNALTNVTWPTKP